MKKKPNITTICAVTSTVVLCGIGLLYIRTWQNAELERIEREDQKHQAAHDARMAPSRELQKLREATERAAYFYEREKEFKEKYGPRN